MIWGAIKMYENILKIIVMELTTGNLTKDDRKAYLDLAQSIMFNSDITGLG